MYVYNVDTIEKQKKGKKVWGVTLIIRNYNPEINKNVLLTSSLEKIKLKKGKEKSDKIQETKSENFVRQKTVR